MREALAVAKDGTSATPRQLKASASTLRSVAKCLERQAYFYEECAKAQAYDQWPALGMPEAQADDC